MDYLFYGRVHGSLPLFPPLPEELRESRFQTNTYDLKQALSQSTSSNRQNHHTGLHFTEHGQTCVCTHKNNPLFCQRTTTCHLSLTPMRHRMEQSKPSCYITSCNLHSSAEPGRSVLNHHEDCTRHIHNINTLTSCEMPYTMDVYQKTAKNHQSISIQDTIF